MFFSKYKTISTFIILQNLTGDWDLEKIGTLSMKSLPNDLIPHVQGKPVEWIDFKDECKTSEFKLPNDINLIKTNPVLEWIIKRLYKLNFPPTVSTLVYIDRITFFFNYSSFNKVFFQTICLVQCWFSSRIPIS